MGEITFQEVLDTVFVVVREEFYVPPDVDIVNVTTLGELIDNDHVGGDFSDILGLASAIAEHLGVRSVADHINLHAKNEEDIRNLSVLGITRIVIDSLNAEGI